MNPIDARIASLQNEVNELSSALQQVQESANDNFKLLWLLIHNAGGQVRIPMKDLINMPAQDLITLSTWRDLPSRDIVIEAEVTNSHVRRRQLWQGS